MKSADGTKKYFMYTERITQQDVHENLVDYLPIEQRIYFNTKAYSDLSVALFEYLAAKGTDLTEKFAALAVMRLAFNHLCETTPSPLGVDYDAC